MAVRGIKQLIIYKVTNVINGKVYIGQTKRDLQLRWREHCACKKDRLFNRAIEKYGVKNFTVEQIDVACSQEELNEKETYWIKFFDSANKENGYNLSLGGEFGSFNEDVLRRMSESHKGAKNHFYGRKHTSESKKRMSETSKIKNNFVKVRCVETGEVFNSIVDASKTYNLKPTHITRVCKGKRNMTGGYHWEYADCL